MKLLSYLVLLTVALPSAMAQTPPGPPPGSVPPPGWAVARKVQLTEHLNDTLLPFYDEVEDWVNESIGEWIQEQNPTQAQINAVQLSVTVWYSNWDRAINGGETPAGWQDGYSQGLANLNNGLAWDYQTHIAFNAAVFAHGEFLCESGHGIAGFAYMGLKASLAGKGVDTNWTDDNGDPLTFPPYPEEEPDPGNGGGGQMAEYWPPAIHRVWLEPGVVLT